MRSTEVFHLVPKPLPQEFHGDRDPGHHRQPDTARLCTTDYVTYDSR